VVPVLANPRTQKEHRNTEAASRKEGLVMTKLEYDQLEKIFDKEIRNHINMIEAISGSSHGNFREDHIEKLSRAVSARADLCRHWDLICISQPALRLQKSVQSPDEE
jgi:hypothetical protein